MKIDQAIDNLDKNTPNPSLGLPEDIFLFVSRMTPIINVDLLIKDENGRILLSWRDDIHSGSGWHIPGGIVRYKETLEKRIQEVAKNEIGAEIQYDPIPLALHQIFRPQKNRGHFISILYNCFLTSKFVPINKNLKKTDNGYLAWHKSCPKNLIKIQQIYKNYMKKI